MESFPAIMKMEPEILSRKRGQNWFEWEKVAAMAWMC